MYIYIYTYVLEIPHIFHTFSGSRHHHCGSAVSFRVAHLHPRRRFRRIALEEVHQTLQRRTANVETGASEGEKQQQPEISEVKEHHWSLIIIIPEHSFDQLFLDMFGSLGV